MSKLDSILRMRRELLDLAHRHGALGLAVFGSVARQSDRQDSDVDFLVECGPRMSLIDLQALHDDLESRLSTRVDLVSTRSLKSPAREQVLDESVSL